MLFFNFIIPIVFVLRCKSISKENTGSYDDDKMFRDSPFI